MNHPIQHTISRKECVERRTDEPNLKGMEGGGVAVPLRLRSSVKRDPMCTVLDALITAYTCTPYMMYPSRYASAVDVEMRDDQGSVNP